MKVNLPRVCSFLVCFIALTWFITNFYNKATRGDSYSLNGVYSPTLKEFIIWQMEPSKISYITENGRVLTKKDAQINMPFIFARTANKFGVFPMNINGMEHTFEDSLINSEYIRVYPRAIFNNALPINALLESSPIGASFESPQDILVFKKNYVNYIHTQNGTLNKQKSTIFTSTFKNAGVTFPIKLFVSNPSPLKSIDEGTLIVDNNKNIFQLKIVKNEPVIKNLNIKIPENPLYISINENERKKYLGLVATDKNVYLLTHANTLIKLPINDYNPNKTSLTIRLTSIYQSLIDIDISSKKTPVKYIATNENFDILHVNNQTYPQKIINNIDIKNNGLSFLTPFEIKQFKYNSNDVLFDIKISPNILFVVFGILFAQILYFISCKYRKVKIEKLNILIIIFTGIPGFISLTLFGPILKKY